MKTLILELPDSLDEIKGRNIAKSLNVEIIGTIGIILLAHKHGLVDDVLGKINRLVDQGFRLSEKIIDKLTEVYGDKK
jgi:predicted nucleic acid-binding protein